MAAKKLNVAKVKGTTFSGMSFEIAGNVAGVCQELFCYINSGRLRQIVLDEMQKQHIAMTEREAVAAKQLEKPLV